jgi:hypothetical protein
MPVNSSLHLVQALYVDLQVPEMLLQTFLREEMTHNSSKLPGPETVLPTLFAEGKVQRLSGTRSNAVVP